MPVISYPSSFALINYCLSDTCRRIYLCICLLQYSTFANMTSSSASYKTFGRGPALISLRLHSIEILSHDTKRFRFALPSENAVSGLDLTGN